MNKYDRPHTEDLEKLAGVQSGNKHSLSLIRPVLGTPQALTIERYNLKRNSKLYTCNYYYKIKTKSLRYYSAKTQVLNILQVFISRSSMESDFKFSANATQLGLEIAVDTKIRFLETATAIMLRRSIYYFINHQFW